MEVVAEPQAYAVDPAPEQFQEPQKKTGRRWMKHWVPQDTVLGSGCLLLKWITEDVLSQLQTKQNDNVVEEEQEPEEEHEVVYLCTYEGCGKIFPEASGLRKHAHVHGEKQYICKYEGCGKRFVDSSKLKRHCLIHTGEKHFICPFEGCGKAFSLDFNLRSHMRTHTGENYHICPYEDCGKRYAHEYKLKAHMRSFHDKNIPEAMVVSPVTDPERDVVAPKCTPPPPPQAVAEKPFACPFDGCNKRYIHEYKLNLHLKNAHMINDIVDEGFRPGRGGPQNEDEIEDESDQDVFQEVVPKYYEQAPKSVEPAQKRKSAPKSSGKGKQRNLSKPPAKITKRKRANPIPESNLKLDIKHNSAGGSGMSRQEQRQDIGDDSEETEDEDRDNTEEEDNVKHMGGRHMGQHMSGMMDVSPMTDPERDIVVPKYTPPRPPTVAEKPFACPFDGCSKRYIHEYKLNLHLKNAHMINDTMDESFRQGRGGTQNDDEIEYESDQDVFQEVVPKSVEPVQKRKAAPKASGKGKLRVVSKPPAKVTKRKRANATPPESNLKVDIKHSSAGRSGLSRQEQRRDVGDDSEETEDEDRDNTEDEEEDNVKHVGGGHMGQHMGGMMDEDDDEETEED